MDKFVYTYSEDIKNNLLGRGLKMLFEKYIDNEKVYVFLNSEKDLLMEFSSEKGQLYTSNTMFF